MAKILALDIGGKRTGIAETDSLQIIASPLGSVATEELLPTLLKMKEEEEFEVIVLGDPISLTGGDSHNSERVRQWQARLQKQLPEVKIVLHDERFSSRLAMRQMIDSGMKKGRRREKGELDRMSAAVILQSYLQSRA